MTYMSKDQLRQHLLNAPAGTTPGGIIAALRSQGVQMEGDPQQSVSKFSNPMSPFSVENQKPQSGFLTSVGHFIGSVSPYAKEVGQGISAAVQGAASGLNEAASNFQSGRQGFGSSTLQATGALAGGAANVLAAPLTPIVEPILKPVIQSYQQSPGLIGPIVSKGNEVAQSFSAAHPEAAANIKAGVQIASLPLAMTSVEPTINAVGKSVTGLGQKTLATLPTLELPNPFRKSLEEVISTGMEKGVKPQFRGQMRSSATALQDYNVKATDAVRNILDQDNLKTISYVDDTGEVISQGHAPRNLGEFAQAIDQTKKNIFDKYSALTQQATGRGKEIDLQSIAQKLLDYADDPVKQLADKSKTKYAQEVAADLLRHGKLDPVQTENLIKELNQGLVKAYAEKGAKGISEVDMSIANELRNQLDSVVLESTGQEYQSLKSAYGALKSIEKDVGHRALIAARANVKGLPQLTDIFTGGDLVAGVVTGNPALVAKGAAGKAISSYYKFINNPDTQIMRMFSKANSILNTPAQEMSLLGKAQAAAKAASVQSVGSQVLQPPSKILSEVESSPTIVPDSAPKVNPLELPRKGASTVDDFANLTPEEKATGLIGGSDSVATYGSSKMKSSVAAHEDHSIRSLLKRNNNVQADIEVKPDSILLRDMKVPEDLRGKGYATKFLKDLTDNADISGKKIELVAMPTEAKSSVEAATRSADLVKMYEKYGFKNIDDNPFGYMVRKPTEFSVQDIQGAIKNLKGNTDIPKDLGDKYFNIEMKYSLDESYSKSMNESLVKMQQNGYKIEYKEGSPNSSLLGFTAKIKDPNGVAKIYDAKSLSKVGETLQYKSPLPSVGGGLEPLVKEARKFKSASDFVEWLRKSVDTSTGNKAKDMADFMAGKTTEAEKVRLGFIKTLEANSKGGWAAAAFDLWKQANQSK